MVANWKQVFAFPNSLILLNLNIKDLNQLLNHTYNEMALVISSSWLKEKEHRKYLQKPLFNAFYCRGDIFAEVIVIIIIIILKKCLIQSVTFGDDLKKKNAEIWHWWFPSFLGMAYFLCSEIYQRVLRVISRTWTIPLMSSNIWGI